MQVRKVVAENEGVVFVTGFSKESWFDSSRSLSKFLQLASNRVFLGGLKFPSSDQPLAENDVRAFSCRARLAVAGGFFVKLGEKSDGRKSIRRTSRTKTSRRRRPRVEPQHFNTVQEATH